MATSEKNKRRNCPVCGARSAMVFEKRAAPVEYKGHKRAHDVTTWWCTQCDDGILEPEMLAARERTWIELRAEVEQVMLPEQVRAIREKLGLSQRVAGALLGGGVHAFQKYESGETIVSAPMQNLLRLLDKDPSRKRELMAAQVRTRARQHTVSRAQKATPAKVAKAKRAERVEAHATHAD